MESIYKDRDNTVLGISDENSEIFIVQLVGTVKRLHYRKVFEEILKKAKKQPFQKILLNYQGLENNPDVGKRWLTTYFIRRFYRITEGLHLAIVSPQTKLERTSVALFYSLIRTLGFTVSVKFFDSVLEAREWLEEYELEEADEEEEYGENKNQQKVKEITLDKQKRLKFRIKFDPKGQLEEKEKTPMLPSINLKEIFTFYRGK